MYNTYIQTREQRQYKAVVRTTAPASYLGVDRNIFGRVHKSLKLSKTFRADGGTNEKRITRYFLDSGFSWSVLRKAVA